MYAITLFAMVAVYLGIIAGVTYGLTRLGKSRRAKRTIASVSLLAFVALSVWDDVWGYVRLQQLCAAEGHKIRWYRTVSLGPAYWNADGSPNFIRFAGPGLFDPFLHGRYQITGRGTTLSRRPEIVQSETMIVDLRTKESLASYATFVAARGWILDAMGAHRRTCPNRPSELERSLVMAAFRKSLL